MTAAFYPFDMSFLARAATRTINEFKSVFGGLETPSIVTPRSAFGSPRLNPTCAESGVRSRQINDLDEKSSLHFWLGRRFKR